MVVKSILGFVFWSALLKPPKFPYFSHQSSQPFYVYLCYMVMEEKKTAKKTTKKAPDVLIKEAYVAYILEHGERPASVFKFVKSLKVKEEVFYEHFNAFQNIENEIWADVFQETMATLKSDAVYDEYSVREKMLAFFYTYIEQLKAKRSFILQTVDMKAKPQITPPYLVATKKHFKQWVAEVLLEGEETEEITMRPVIGKRYDDALWFQFLFVLGFWAKDHSKAFEKTDAAIEKSVNLAFDLMGKGPLDTMLDFGKFLFQNRS